VRVTKRFGEGDWDQGGGLDFIRDVFADEDGGKPCIWLTIGGNFNASLAAGNEVYVPDYIRPGGAGVAGGGSFGGLTGIAPPDTKTMTQLMADSGFASPSAYQRAPGSGFDWEGEVKFQPADSDWVLKAGIRYGRTGRKQLTHKSEIPRTVTKFALFSGFYLSCAYAYVANYDACHLVQIANSSMRKTLKQNNTPSWISRPV
jgi:hypothetical protein